MPKTLLTTRNAFRAPPFPERELSSFVFHMNPHCFTYCFILGVWEQEKCISFRFDWSPSHWGDLGSLSNGLLAQKAEGKKQVGRKGRREVRGRGGKRKGEEKERGKGRKMGEGEKKQEKMKKGRDGGREEGRTRKKERE